MKLFFTVVVVLLMLAELRHTTAAARRCRRSRFSHRKLMKAAKYLKTYGYITLEPSEIPRRNLECEISEGIALMQDFAGLPITASLNQRTIKEMEKPRCGLPDFYPEGNRRKRFVLHPIRWPFGTVLHTQVMNYTTDLTVPMQEDIAKTKLEEWLAACPTANLKFHYAKEGFPEDELKVKIFHSAWNLFGDLYDVSDQTLAYSYFPPVGQMYFNLFKKVSDKHVEKKGVTLAYDYGTIMLHELGHILGLEHSDVRTDRGRRRSIMSPNYDPTVTKLQPDDIAAVRRLFSVRGNGQRGKGQRGERPGGRPLPGRRPGRRPLPSRG